MEYTIKLLETFASMLDVLVWPALFLFVLLRFGPVLSNLLSNVIEFTFKFPGVEAKLIKQNVESAVENSELRSQAVEEIPGEFEKIKLYIDWQKFHEAVVAWARENKAQNAWNLGSKNFLRCLYDLGIPGGKRFDLEKEQDGSLKNQ